MSINIIIDVMIMSDPSLKNALFANDQDYLSKNHTLAKISKFIQPVNIQEKKTFGICMNGGAVYKNAVTGMTDISLKILERNNMELTDVNWLLVHQANQRITHAIAERLQIPLNRIMESIEECANTSVATIPISLDKYVRHNSELKHGDVILMATAGSGMTFSSCIVRW